MDNLNIKRSDCVKYLGVLLHEHLSWKNQVQKLNKSLSKLDGSLPANPVNDRRVTNAVTLKSTFRLP